MTCTHMYGGVVCWSPVYRLRLADGRRVFMEWHSHLGPSIFHDRACRRVFCDWYDDPMICDALEWFIDRGRKT